MRSTEAGFRKEPERRPGTLDARSVTSVKERPQDARRVDDAIRRLGKILKNPPQDLTEEEIRDMRLEENTEPGMFYADIFLDAVLNS